MAAIVGSSIGLASENPVDEAATINHVLGQFDYGFTLVFTIEMLLKVRLT